MTLLPGYLVLETLLGACGNRMEIGDIWSLSVSLWSLVANGFGVTL